VDFRGENGERARYGQNVSIPSDFPTDVPVYDDAAVIATSQKAEGVSLQFTTTDSAAEVIAWYKAQLDDWKVVVEGNFTGAAIVQFEKDGVQIAVSTSGNDELTTVVVARTEE
jgi:hypothetical protein